MNFVDVLNYNIVLTILICFYILVLLYTIIVNIIGLRRKSWLMNEIKGKHVLITGGSQGLGLALACEFRKIGAKVTIMARNVNTLKEAEAQIRKAGESENQPFIYGDSQYVSADVTNAEQLKEAIDEAQASFGPVYMLFPCAGKAYTGYFHERSLDDFRRSMELNFFGTLNTMKLIVPSMMERNEGHICFVTSTLAIVSFMGYTTYCPTKYALRGLCDSLRNELSPYKNISVGIAFPPGMYTPGFDIENETKPVETKAIEDGEPVYQPEDVAKSIINSFFIGEYMIDCGDFGTGLLKRFVGGLTPRFNWLLDLALVPILVPASVVYVKLWDGIARSKHTNPVIRSELKPINKRMGLQSSNSNTKNQLRQRKSSK